VQDGVLALTEAKPPGISVAHPGGPKRRPGLSRPAREAKLPSHRFDLPGKFTDEGIFKSNKCYIFPETLKPAREGH
jgi:hypothetical protein